MGKKTEKCDIIRKYIDEHPRLKQKRAIAAEVMALHPGMWSDIESARTSVRFVTGAQGAAQQKNVAHGDEKYFFSGFEQWAEENLNTEEEPWEVPFEIPSSIKQLNIIADLHSVHLKADVMEQFLRATPNKEALLLNGDLMDSESISRHLKSHNVVEYDTELDICHQILKGLKEEFDHVYFKQGNHDFWLQRYLLSNCREIFKLRGLELGELLRLGELGVHEIHNLKYIKYHDLDIVHGHEFPGFGMGKFPSVGLLDKWQTFRKKSDVKILCSHSHRADMTISRKSKDGKFGQSWVTPCMCGLGAKYAPYAGWDNGWATATIEEDEVRVKLIRV